MEAKHTPGPWERHATFIYSGSLKGGLIATVHDCLAVSKTAREMASGISVDEGAANGRLCAAAPDLLAALEEVGAAFQTMPRKGQFRSERDDYILAASTMKRIKEVIAKATGA